LLDFAGAVITNWQDYSLTVIMAINARTAAIPPKTISSQVAVTNAFKTTQIPREHIAKVRDFISLTSFEFYRKAAALVPVKYIDKRNT
jgi:hypothetical protein